MGGGGEVVRSACVRALWRVAPLVPCGTLGVKAGRCSLTQAICVLAVVHLAGSRRRCARRLVPAMPTVASHAEACAAALDAADPGGQRRLTQELEFVQVRSTPEAQRGLLPPLRCAALDGKGPSRRRQAAQWGGSMPARARYPWPVGVLRAGAPGSLTSPSLSPPKRFAGP